MRSNRNSQKIWPLRTFSCHEWSIGETLRTPRATMALPQRSPRIEEISLTPEMTFTDGGAERGDPPAEYIYINIYGCLAWTGQACIQKYLCMSLAPRVVPMTVMVSNRWKGRCAPVTGVAGRVDLNRQFTCSCLQLGRRCSNPLSEGTRLFPPPETGKVLARVIT